MNSAISNLRPYCSPIVKVILFFYSVGPAYFSSYFFLSPFLGFLLSLIFTMRASNHFSALSLSLSLYLTFSLPLRQNASRSIKASQSLSQWFLFFFFSLWFDGRFGSGCVSYGFGGLYLTGMSIGIEGRSAWVIG